MRELWDKIIEYLPIAALAGFAGFCRAISSDGIYNWKRLVPEVLLAILCGLIVNWLMSEYVDSTNLRSCAVALAGYTARPIMDCLAKKFENNLKKKIK